MQEFSASSLEIGAVDNHCLNKTLQYADHYLQVYSVKILISYAKIHWSKISDDWYDSRGNLHEIFVMLLTFRCSEEAQEADDQRPSTTCHHYDVASNEVRVFLFAAATNLSIQARMLWLLPEASSSSKLYCIWMLFCTKQRLLSSHQ